MNEMGFVVERIRKTIFSKLEENCMQVLSDLFAIYKKNHDNETLMNYKYLKYSKNEFDYFNLVIIEAFLDTMQTFGLIKEDLTDQKRIPSGSDNAYGRYFEKKMIDFISTDFELQSEQKQFTDAIFKLNEHEDFFLEVKCNKTDTEEQVKKYLLKTGLKRYVTINGSSNSVKINFMDIFRMAKKLQKKLIIWRY